MPTSPHPNRNALIRMQIEVFNMVTRQNIFPVLCSLDSVSTRYLVTWSYLRCASSQPQLNSSFLLLLMKFATGFIASCVGLVAVGCGSSSVKSDSGTSGSPTEFSSPGTGGGSAVMTSGTPGVSTSTVPWSRPTVNPNPSCAGRRIGVYSWDASYWRGDNPELLNFLDSDMGRQFACGSTFINIADRRMATDLNRSMSTQTTGGGS